MKRHAAPGSEAESGRGQAKLVTTPSTVLGSWHQLATAWRCLSAPGWAQEKPKMTPYRDL